MNKLFAVVLNPGAHQVNAQCTLWMRNFPASFWIPPQARDIDSYLCYSREKCLKNSSKDPFLPGIESLESSLPQQKELQVQPDPNA